MCVHLLIVTDGGYYHCWKVISIILGQHISSIEEYSQRTFAPITGMVCCPAGGHTSEPSRTTYFLPYLRHWRGTWTFAAVAAEVVHSRCGARSEDVEAAKGGCV